MSNWNERVSQAIYKRLANNWNEGADGKIAWPNTGFDSDSEAGPWIRVTIIAVEARQYTISGLAAPSGQLLRWRVVFQVFTAVHSGTQRADQIADRLSDLFNHQRIAVEGAGEATLLFGVPQPPVHVGDPPATSGRGEAGLRRWHQANMSVSCEFLAP